MTPVESPFQDVIPSVLEVNWVLINKQFLYKTMPNHHLKSESGGITFCEGSR